MAEEQKPNFGEALGAALFAVCIIAIIGCIFMLKIEGAKEMAKEYQKALSTPYGHAIGKVKSVETWKAEKFVHKEGNATLTLDITDRCKVTFEDGRTKEMLGMPKEAIPTGKEIAIVWAKYDLFLEAVDAEEFRKRPKTPDEAKP